MTPKLRYLLRLIMAQGAMLAGFGAVSAAELDRPAEAIQDNSFLVEEAYNQEAGVVQHIFTAHFGMNRLAGDDERALDLSFTQEWPLFTQRHQLSYTVPYAFTDGPAGGGNGFGDVLLNYRLQALFESERVPAFAPRVSLVLPTGDESEGLGQDTLGWQFNLPFSKVVSDRVTLHANAGLSFFPDVHDRDPMNYRLAGSAIYAASRDLNFMLEWVGDWLEEADQTGRMERGFSSLLCPGVRYAINGENSQWVLGVAMPVGITEDAPDIGVFLYASFEHLLGRSKN